MFRAALYKGTRPGIPGLYNRFVRWWDRGIYSHCELVFSDGYCGSASFMDGGVRLKQIDFSGSTDWDFVDLPPTLEAPARAWFEAHAGAAYDILGNIRFIWPFMPDDPNKYFCSEAFCTSLGIQEAWRVSPNELMDICKLIHSQVGGE